VRFSRLDAHLLRITYLDIFDILEDFSPFTLSFLSCRIHLVFQIDKLQRSVEKLYVTSIYSFKQNIATSTESEEGADGKKEDMLASVAIYD